jgi:hypothetical protein
VTWVLAWCFWDGLTDRRSDGTWRALGFAYAAIYFLGNTYVYFAKTPIQLRKLFPFMAALMLAPFMILAVDCHVGGGLFPAMFFTPFMVAISADLNPRSPKRLGPERATDMGDSDPAVFNRKTALRTSVGQVVCIVFIQFITRIGDSRNPRLDLVGSLEFSVLMIPVGVTFMMTWYWISWKASRRFSRLRPKYPLRQGPQ